VNIVGDRERSPVRFKAVLWDVDGTLVDSESTHSSAIVEALQASGIRLTEDVRDRVFGTSIDETYAILASTYNSIPSCEAFIAAKTRVYLERATDIRLRAGVELCLHRLTDIGVRSAFVSNTDRIVVDANLRAAGVSKPGTVSVSRNDVRKGKPDPEPFLRAAHLLGAPPEQCIVIKDSHVGVAAGLAAGMHVIAWPQSGANAEEFSSRAIFLTDKNLWVRLSRLCGHDEAIASSVSSPPEE
jgi:beta-phosphoglucomutase-like phosphatase (HAD superfamily)